MHRNSNEINLGNAYAALGESAEIERAAGALDLDDRSHDPTIALARLAAVVIEPLGLDKATKRVLISPSGALSYVPFAALIPRATVAYEPSGTTYALLFDEGVRRGSGVLALGDPDYATRVDERALAVARGGLALVALPGTREEAKAIGDVTLLGAQASESGLREAVSKRPRWRAVHFACPGLVDPERPSLSSLALTPAGDDDGFLSALEIFRIKIPPTSRCSRRARPARERSSRARESSG